MNEVERLSNENYLESIRAHAAFQNPCDMRERDGILLIAGASDFPGGYWNAAARTNLDVRPEKLFDAAKEFFRAKKRGYSISVIEKQDAGLEKHLLAKKFESRFEIPCMSVTAPLPVPKAADGVRVETISTRRHLEDFVEVSVLAYAMLGLPEVHTRAMFSKPEALLADNLIGIIAYRGGEPLATSIALMTGGCGGLYWIGTRPNAQRLGLGALMTVVSANMAFGAGAKVVTLQASKFGEPVYARLGFKTYDVLRRYGPRLKT
ncbi:MAG: GNAT family N-acetyltransferase [Xanthobacteraceae bacterium]|nr:GNAT family N-acetyltransferase [Xanthobacteraceae bacterium]